MTKNILLETKTANLLELLGNGKIYRVPQYQRDYSWGEEQWEDLWNDIVEMHDQRNERHYMGALVIEATSDREFLIIDGQQRLATLSTLALAVISHLFSLADKGVEADSNTERAEALRRRFIGEKDPASLRESSKLFLNETDDPFYQDCLVQLREPINPRGLVKSNRLLWDCFQYYRKKILDLAGISDSGEALAALLNETIARQLMFIQILVDDEVNAYTVFETLNARGLELSSTDLLKNYLFSRISVPSDLQALSRMWRQLIGTVQQERFPEFLRYHLLCEHKQVRRQRLFKMVRATVRTGRDVFDLIRELENRAELFAALSDPYHEFWASRQECRPYIKELKLFGVRQMTPLLFAAWESMNADFSQILKLVSTVAFRYTVVGGLNTNELEPVYHDAAKAVLNGSARTTRDVFQILRRIYVDDERFIQDFSRLEVNTTRGRKRIAKYILAKLQADASGRAVDWETDPGTIEHILPENPADEWADMIPEQHWASAIYRVGNLTLLEASANREMGNSNYQQKAVAYASSQYEITRQIPQDAPEEWSMALLNDRQMKLARRAAHIWRADYS